MDEILTQWNNAAKTYFVTQEASDDAAFNQAVVKERFSSLSGKKVLDAGCGYGAFTSYFQRIGADVLGCDGSEEMLVIAKEQYPDCKFDLVDLQERLPYQNEQFDLVFCNQVLMDLADIQGLFGEFSRILKTAGILYFLFEFGGPKSFYTCSYGGTLCLQ